MCVAWDCPAGAMLASVGGAPHGAPFEADVIPGAAAGAGLFPAITGGGGCVVEYSVRGDLRLAPPSPDFVPFEQELPSRRSRDPASHPPQPQPPVL